MRSKIIPVEEKPVSGTAAVKPAKQAQPRTHGLSSFATALGLGAVTAAAACCVLPLALASIGVGAGLAAGFASLASVRTPLLVVAGVVLAAAWIVWWRRREAVCPLSEDCAAPTRTREPLTLLIVSTVFIGLAGMFPALETTLMKWVS